MTPETVVFLKMHEHMSSKHAAILSTLINIIDY